MIEQHWQRHTQAPIAPLWDALADTARFNEASRLPDHSITAFPQPDGTQRFKGEARFGPFQLSWEDLPSNWVREQWFEHVRAFDRGPFARFAVTMRLLPDAQGCTVDYHTEAEPRGLAGRALTLAGFFGRMEQVYARLLEQAEAYARSLRATPFDYPRPLLAPRVLARIAGLEAELVAEGRPLPVVETLGRLIREGGENDVRRIRPLELARRGGFAPRETIETCLDAARRGLLDLSWDLLCPRCRGALRVGSSLAEVPRDAHCDTCAIRFDRDFSKNVELSFHPAKAIRPIVEGQFCLLGPMSSPHILVHLTLAPGERRTIPLRLGAGHYRLRTLEAGPETALDREESDELPAVRLTGEAVVLAASPDGELLVENATGNRRTFVLEDRAWVKEALTADKVGMLQTFRDLFSDQLLRPGDEVGIERVAILFTDLAGSTALYQRVGEAVAFGRVREHFDFTTAIVRRHDGAVVKTIGDAIMAAFADPLDAVRAAIAIQHAVAEMNATSDLPLQLKIGIHVGPSIAVTLNERLDYFGTTSNLAARLQQVAGPGEIVISNLLAQDEVIQELVGPLIAEIASIRLRGFDEPVPCLRLRPTPAG